MDELIAEARGFADWLKRRALPVWGATGFGADGGFRETIDLDGRTTSGPRRARVQTRQLYVYCQAGLLGWSGPWRSIAEAALSRLRQSYLRPDGASCMVLGEDWTVLDARASLYDQAFVLFALNAARRAGLDGDDPGASERDAARLRDYLLSGALPNGAMREVGEHPFQSNAHMHLFEAALAWAEISDDPAWNALADRIAALAFDHFIDAEGGFLREFFDEDWSPAAGDDGRLVEPGHQFEWAWLLTRYGRARGRAEPLEAARALYFAGSRGVLHRPAVAVDALWDDLGVRSDRARLWPQTEWLKAALILAEEAVGEGRQARLKEAAAALRALTLYFTEDGLWRDKRLADGAFVEEPAPASSLYHIMVAFDQLGATIERLGLDARPLDLR